MEFGKEDELLYDCDEKYSFTYKMEYKAPMYRMELDTESDANYVDGGGLDDEAALARKTYIRAFQSLLIENDISKSRIKGLVDFDKLNSALEERLAGENDFSDEEFTMAASSIIQDFIANAVDGAEEEKLSVATTILTDILYAIYWMIACPEKIGDECVSLDSDSQEHSSQKSSEEINPNAVRSPFLSAVNQDKSGKSSFPDKKLPERGKKKKRRTEPRYSYFVGNKDSILVSCLDGIFRYIFRNNMQHDDMFLKVQESAEKLGAVDTTDETEARQKIIRMFTPESPLPSWRKYYGTVVCFMQHLFPVIQEGRSFDVEQLVPEFVEPGITLYTSRMSYEIEIL
jgi:hypothetical protein